ncbi:MAG: LCP family protein [Ilumatobacter sp.]
MGEDSTPSGGQERPKLRRSWPQRLLIAGLSVSALGSVGAAIGVWFVQQQLEDRQLVVLETSADDATAVAVPASGDSDAAATGVVEFDDPGQDALTISTDPAAPVETFPPAEPGARNILITGADNNACLDPESRFAPAFGDRSSTGERSDTIMMWRVNPATNQVAVLSFPRDLWVRIDGRSSKGRINEAYTRDDPQRLINTIDQNFGIETDHFVQVDFCAFKELVDAVGGVAVPFTTGIRDGNTGLAVPEGNPGCFTFSGEHALAYVRSRKIEFYNSEGRWERDGTSDLGRITRQQDFIRRVGDQLLANVFSPSVVNSLLGVSRQYIVTDTGLTPDKVLELSGVLANTDPAAITTYQIEARGTTIQGNSVLEPRIGGDNMQAVLSLFRGEVTLAERPVQDTDVNTGSADDTDEAGDITAPNTTVPVIDPDRTTTTTTTTTVVVDSAPTTAEASPFVTIPEIEAEENPFGVYPDPDVSCT